MLDKVTSQPIRIDDLIRNRSPNYSLSSEFYTSQELFDLDMRAIFGRQWIFVGVEADIPEPGDYFLSDFGPYSILVLRSDDEEVRAFHNVCRHRGARLLQEQKGAVGNIVCPYHQWTYNTDGELIHAESLQETIDRNCLGLKAVHAKSIAGLVFVCLAKEPPDDVEDFSNSILPYLDHYKIADGKVAAQVDLVENGNWKLTIENNRECYHCGGHPELLQSIFGTFGYSEHDIGDSRRDAFDEFSQLKADIVQKWEKAGLPWQAIERLDDRDTGFRVERIPIKGAGESMTMDGAVASQKMLGDLSRGAWGRVHLHVQPNTWCHFNNDHAIVFSVLPIDAGRTLVRTRWLVHKDAVEGVDYDVEKLTHVWRMTNSQDAAFVELAHRGACSPAYEPGPYTSNEYQVEAFCNWYIQRLSHYLNI